MNIEQFRTELMDALSERVGSAYKVIPCETLKNNGIKLYGVILKRSDRNIAPTIYIEHIFAEYKKHNDINKATDEVIALNDEYAADDFDVGFYEDYSRVKDKLFVKLVSRDENREMLENTLHRDFMDLSLIVYCDVSSVCKFDASIIVKHEHVKRWRVNHEDIIDIAIENTRKLGCSIRDVTDFLFKKNGKDIPNKPRETELHRKMYVMTNKNLFYGAICMTYDDRLDEFCHKNKCNTYIIPSSIHEGATRFAA